MTSLRLVSLTRSEAYYLRGIVRIYWHKEIYRAISYSHSDIRTTSLGLVESNDKWMEIYEPIETFLAQVRDRGQLLLTPSLHQRYMELLATDPLPADLPQLTSSDYSSIIVPILPVFKTLRDRMAEADMMDEAEFAVTQNASALKN